MTPEAKVKRVVTKQLKEMGAYYFFLDGTSLPLCRNVTSQRYSKPEALS